MPNINLISSRKGKDLPESVFNIIMFWLILSFLLQSFHAKFLEIIRFKFLEIIRFKFFLRPIVCETYCVIGTLVIGTNPNTY